MKQYFIYGLVLSLALCNRSYAQGGDIKVTQCTKNELATFVTISGISAGKIVSHIARTLKVSVDQLGGVQSNNMFCYPVENGYACSYLMIGSKNIPYPQTDANYGNEKEIICN